MIQKRSRIKINTNLAKIRQAGKNPQEVQKELLEFFEKRGFEYEEHVGYLYQEEITREKAQQIADELKECGVAQFIHDFYVYDVNGKILVLEDRNKEGMQRREPYKKNRVLNYEDLKEFFISRLEIRYCKESEIPIVTEDYNNYRVWLIFAKLEVQGWICVQVAHSKNNIKEEIKFALEHLSKKWDRNACELKNSQFYKCVCPVPQKGENYRDLLYRKIGNEGVEFRICVLNVDKYLGLKKVEKNTNDAERIIEICKNQYAEAKIAYQTLAVYWRNVSSAIDGQTISYAVDHRSEFE